MDNKLLILPFDHRSSFLNEIVSSSNNPKKRIKEMKEMIFESFLFAIKDKNKEDFAILVDEEYGSKILRQSKKMGIKICLPIEKSGQKELGLEFKDKFEEHINKFSPNYVKILIRYNPINKETNKRQLKILSQINDFCNKNKYKVILELLVPPTEEESSIKNYDDDLRYQKTLKSIKEIKNKIKVSVWKLEGFKEEQWKNIISSINKSSKIVFLGRGESKKKVSEWMVNASKFKEIIGFAVGRTIFLKPLKEFEEGKISKEEAIKKIKNNFNFFINLWTSTKKNTNQ